MSMYYVSEIRCGDITIQKMMYISILIDRKNNIVGQYRKIDKYKHQLSIQATSC